MSLSQQLSFPCAGVGRDRAQGGFSVGNLLFFRSPTKELGDDMR